MVHYTPYTAEEAVQPCVLCGHPVYRHSERGCDFTPGSCLCRDPYGVPPIVHNG